MWTSAHKGHACSQNYKSGLRLLSPVLLCSASSMAICMRASNTRALSSQLCQSSSSCSSAAVPEASDTFLVASLHSRSMKPGMFSRATVETADSHENLVVYSNLILSLTLSGPVYLWSCMWIHTPAGPIFHPTVCVYWWEENKNWHDFLTLYTSFKDTIVSKLWLSIDNAKKII